MRTVNTGRTLRAPGSVSLAPFGRGLKVNVVTLRGAIQGGVSENHAIFCREDIQCLAQSVMWSKIAQAGQ
jgi:hypothetical protein